MNPVRQELLQGMPIFGGINDEALQFLLDRSTARTVGTNEYFFREGEKGNSVFVLETGHVAIIKTWQDQDYALFRLGPGDCFGEMELIDLQPRSASVRAEDDCTALEIPAAALHAFYKRDLAQFAMIHMNMGREVSRRLRRADDELFKAKVELRLHHPM